MDGGSVHHKDGFRLRPFTAVVQQLLDKILKCSGVSRSRVDLRQLNAFLRIRGENLKPLLAVELVNLHGRCS